MIPATLWTAIKTGLTGMIMFIIAAIGVTRACLPLRSN
jgi:hypothetical protein